MEIQRKRSNKLTCHEERLRNGGPEALGYGDHRDKIIDEAIRFKEINLYWPNKTEILGRVQLSYWALNSLLNVMMKEGLIVKQKRTSLMIPTRIIPISFAGKP